MIPAMDRLQTAVEQQSHPVLFATLSGAHLYGFASPDSDFDLRGVYVLPLREIAGIFKPQDSQHKTVREDNFELDFVMYEVGTFFEMLLKRDGNVLEQLYSPLVIHTSPAHDALKEIAVGCITRHHAYHYLGFARSQWRLFEKEQPHRVKPLLYVYRVLLTGIHLMRTGEVQANLINLNNIYKLPHIAELIARKTSGAEQSILEATDLLFHQDEVAHLTTELEAARDSTKLPNNPTSKAELNELLLQIRGIA